MVFALQLITDFDQRVNALLKALELTLEHRIVHLGHGNNIEPAGRRINCVRDALGSRDLQRASWDHPAASAVIIEPTRKSVVSTTIEHDVLDEALRACGSDWTAAQAHGLLCGQLAVSGRGCIATWQAQVLADGESTPTGSQCGALLERMAESTWYRLAERQSQFDVVLPDDDEDSARRAQALADWAEAFLHGLVSYSRDEAIRKRLAEEPLSDLIRDLLELTRAEVGARR